MTTTPLRDSRELLPTTPDTVVDRRRASLMGKGLR